MLEIAPNHATDRRITRLARTDRNFAMTNGQVERVQGFSLRLPVGGVFPIDSLLHVT